MNSNLFGKKEKLKFELYLLIEKTLNQYLPSEENK